MEEFTPDEIAALKEMAQNHLALKLICPNPARGDFPDWLMRGDYQLDVSVQRDES